MDRLALLLSVSFTSIPLQRASSSSSLHLYNISSKLGKKRKKRGGGGGGGASFICLQFFRIAICWPIWSLCPAHLVVSATTVGHEKRYEFLSGEVNPHPTLPFWSPLPAPSGFQSMSLCRFCAGEGEGRGSLEGAGRGGVIGPPPRSEGSAGGFGGRFVNSYRKWVERWLYCQEWGNLKLCWKKVGPIVAGTSPP